MPFCCTTDIVTRKLEQNPRVKYPDARKRLLHLMANDQEERNSGNFVTNDEAALRKLTARENTRARAVLDILREIKTPSVQNIGMDGSRAMWLIALHNCDYEGLGQTVLKKMRNLYYRDKQQVFAPGIPYLVDRLAVLRHNMDHSSKQFYGTQKWLQILPDGTTKSGAFTVVNKDKLKERLLKFDISLGATCRHNP